MPQWVGLGSQRDVRHRSMSIKFCSVLLLLSTCSASFCMAFMANYGWLPCVCDPFPTPSRHRPNLNPYLSVTPGLCKFSQRPSSDDLQVECIEERAVATERLLGHVWCDSLGIGMRLVLRPLGCDYVLGAGVELASPGSVARLQCCNRCWFLL